MSVIRTPRVDGARERRVHPGEQIVPARQAAYAIAGGELVFDHPGDTSARSLQRGMGTDVLVDTRFTFVEWGSDRDVGINQNLVIGVRGNPANGG
jgi:hypothetical protein